jgi:CheY-like chemotaxis protein
MKENILLVEDEEALCMALSDRMRKEGYAVDFVTDGEQGYEKATSLPFDLIVLDIMLPGRSGLDLTRDIRTAGLGTPILLLTARSETVDTNGLYKHAFAERRCLIRERQSFERVVPLTPLIARSPAQQRVRERVRPWRELRFSGFAGGHRSERLGVLPRWSRVAGRGARCFERTIHPSVPGRTQQ